MARARLHAVPSPPRRLRVAVVGLGRLGARCAEALVRAPDVTLGGVVRRPASRPRALPGGLPAHTPVAEGPEQLGPLDAAILCVPPECVLDAARPFLSRRIPVVEAARVSGSDAAAHLEAIDHEAGRARAAALVGAGWDPGALPLLRGWLALLAPRGRTEVEAHAAPSLHHTLAARKIAGVRDARCSERRPGSGHARRYLYVELEPEADPERTLETLRADPLFREDETVVVPVDDVAALEEESHGITVERWGANGSALHPRFLLEARFDDAALAAQMLLAAARATPSLGPGAHTLLDVPPAWLFGAASAAAREARPH